MQNEQYHVEAAAFLRAKKHKLELIASILNLSSTATVDALLKKAKSQGLFSESVEFFHDKIPPARLQQLRYLDYVEILGGNLRSASPKMPDQKKHIFRQIYVVDSGTFDDAERMYQTRQARFGLEAAPIICELLGHSHTVGVAWGSTLRAVIGGLTPTYTFRFHNHQPIQFLPTCGEPYGMPLRTDSSSHLAAELDSVINKSGRHSLSLCGVPVVIPKEFANKSERSVVDRFIRCCPAYREIFGDGNANSPRLIDKMDTILTSVGTLDRPWRMCGVELCEIGGIDREQFQKIVLGDIGGVLLQKSKRPDRAELSLMADIESLWTGIRFSDYIELAKRADHNHVGVVVLAIGTNKAKVIHRCVKSGLVNHLICDEALAWALCKETGSLTPDKIRPLR